MLGSVLSYACIPSTRPPTAKAAHAPLPRTLRLPGWSLFLCGFRRSRLMFDAGEQFGSSPSSTEAALATHSATTETRAYSWARTAPSLRSVLTVCACVGEGCGGAEPRTRAHPMDQTVSEEGGRAAGIASRALTAADSMFPSAKTTGMGARWLLRGLSAGACMRGVKVVP